ncbi:hypothetical protein [Halobacillus sp. BAB-2008]|uniref:hypothetical protein n=1 Tax=Halobacillus sp. BAB-2008 TaxID=1246484 RepID=UPI0002A4D13D|nr:hypothetical protein [Halobacillus sp. BAB-2008]ELK46489.1 hypothetical protein D479_10161 [Halobacillus sp. BAB-2008]
MKDESFHYWIGGAALGSWLLHFAGNLDFYEIEKIVSGVVFIFIAVFIYILITFFYYRRR